MPTKAVMNVLTHSGNFSSRFLPVAVDLETTGLNPKKNCIIQIAVQPLTKWFKPFGDPFYTYVRPKGGIDPAAEAVHKIDLLILNAAPTPAKVLTRFIEWKEKIAAASTIFAPLAHNWAFEASFLKEWMGWELFNAIWGIPRDSMILAEAIKDRQTCDGEVPPFQSVSLPAMCKVLDVVNHAPHDALGDALACAEVYRKLLFWERFV